MSEDREDSLIDCGGGCHCGAVQFRVALPASIKAFRCNCSICRRTGFVHVFVTPGHFRLLQGKNELLEYRFHTRAARHLFCRHCGIKSYYVPRSHPDGISVNLNCLEVSDSMTVSVEEFDGANWSQSIEALHQADKQA